jgi:hypothetical protein
MLRRIVLVAALTAALLPGAAVASSELAARSCGITWGSTGKSANPVAEGDLVALRAGRHACFDRLVFDVRGTASGYWVSYVNTMTEDGTGNVVPLRGGAKLSIAVQAPSYDDSGRATYSPVNRRELVPVAGYSTFRQVAWAGSFEGSTTVGLGVRARLPFRVLTLPDRFVVDVAHKW